MLRFQLPGAVQLADRRLAPELPGRRMIQLRRMRACCSVKRARTFLCVLMACLLVAIQQIGFAHALTHLANPAQQSQRNDKQHPAEKVCIECVTFAQIGAGLANAAPAALPAAAHLAVAAIAFRNFAPEFIPAFLSRAPPPAAA